MKYCAAGSALAAFTHALVRGLPVSAFVTSGSSRSTDCPDACTAQASRPLSTTAPCTRPSPSRDSRVVTPARSSRETGP